MTVAIVSSGPTGTRCWSTMSPESTSSTIRNSVAPVLVSPLAIAHTVGEKPRYAGRRESWKTNAPFRADPYTSGGTR
ncbi:MAG: hypothetical protein M3068_08475 [Gemmatimonadota bacterium]|nr:hypothetical protein [Gemmatimonadota bacterium]